MRKDVIAIGSLSSNFNVRHSQKKNPSPKKEEEEDRKDYRISTFMSYCIP